MASALASHSYTFGNPIQLSFSLVQNQPGDLSALPKCGITMIVI